MRAFFLAFLTLIALPLAALAQAPDRPNTILVLDGSGSMWGQIDGVNKIVIARNVIADMLAEMSDDVSLGLTVYGHRERGACGDIETIVAPAPGTRDRILEAVNAINPRGRTPMTDSVVAAAQSLRHTEEAATVILVSDGIENCNPDPCAIAAELEATGVAFTAHVIGFDVASEPEARAQMQCIADTTGGQFLTADNASELSAALQQVVAAQPTMMRLEARIETTDERATRPVTWRILGEGGTIIADGLPGATLDFAFDAGLYTIEATRSEPSGPVTYQINTIVEQDRSDLIVVPMPPIVDTSPLTFTARVEPDMSVPASPLNWTLRDATGTVLLGPVAAPGGNVALLPGDYTLSVERVAQGTTHEARFTIAPNTPSEVVIPLPALSLDVTLIARIGTESGLPVTDPVIWEVTPLDPAPEIATTNPATTALGRGAYRVTGYWTVQETEAFTDFVIVDQPREIIVVFDEPAVTATLTAPATAPVGADIEVTWQGPGAQGDYLIIRHPDTNRLLSTEAISDPVETLRMPSEPGTYDITYRQNGGNGDPIGTTSIEITDVPTTLDAPDTVAIGSDFAVTWEGPGYAQDRIAIVPAGERALRSSGGSLRATAENPRELTAPTEPGEYELHYVLRVDERVMVTRPLSVTDVQASVTAPASAPAGSAAEIGWTGPENDDDFIGIRAPDAEGYHRFINTARLRDGNPLDLLMPSEPGPYVIEYILGEGRIALVAASIEVTPTPATLTAPASAVAGDTIEIGFTGPGYDNDFIAVRAPDAEGYHRFINTIAVDRGNPARLTMPSAPGTYMIEYIEGQDRTALAASEIIISAASAGLTAPANANVGDTIEIGWTGPDYDNDFIAIRRPDSEGYHRFETTVATDRGNPARLEVPSTPGTYLIEYIEGQDRTALAVSELIVAESAASVTAPTSAVAGSTVEVGWTGPAADRDFIAIGLDGAEGSARWENYTRVDTGNPLQLLVPTTPGTYLVQYFLDQDRVVLASVPLSVTPAEATLSAPQSAVAGSSIEIGWTGPDYGRDFIAIGPAGASGGDRWQNYTRTSEGTPLQLLVPPSPGTYEIRYFMDQDRLDIATATLNVTPAQATLTAPATAAPGSEIEIGWTGPDYSRDFIAIGRAGETGAARWEEYTRTSQGAPLRLRIPETPGAYVIRYFMDQGRTPIAQVPITVQ